MKEDPLGGPPERVTPGLIGAIAMLLVAGFVLFPARALRDCGADAQFILAIGGVGIATLALLVALSSNDGAAVGLNWGAGVVEISWLFLASDGPQCT